MNTDRDKMRTFEEKVEDYLDSIVPKGPTREAARLHENKEALVCDIPDVACLMEATQFFFWQDSEGKAAITRCPDHIPGYKIHTKQARTITRDEYIVARVIDT